MLEAITKISINDEVTLISIETDDTTIVNDVLAALSNESINVDMISQCGHAGGPMDLCFSISDNDLSTALSTLSVVTRSGRRGRCSVSSGNIKLEFYGEQMRVMPGVASEVLSLIIGCGAKLKLITTSTVDVSVLVDAHYGPDLMEAINKNTKVEVKREEF